MDWIKVLNRHILFEYTDLRPTEFEGWIKLMALCAYLEHEPSREQMVQHVHHATLESLEKKLMTRSCTLHDIFMKVLCDAHDVIVARESSKKRMKEYRERKASVTPNVPVLLHRREEKRREDNIKNKTKYLDSVYLTEDEYKKLQEVMGQKSLDHGIEQLDYSITVKGGKYKDHYKTLLNWLKRGFISKAENDHSGKAVKRLPTPEEELEELNQWERPAL